MIQTKHKKDNLLGLNCSVMFRNIRRWASMPVSLRDFLILTALVVLATFQPFYLHGQLNLFELGLYLPGIDGIWNGQIPYRDFFYLRGPFEIFMPAVLMKIFGQNVAVLATYFYVGNVLTLVVCVLLAQSLLRSRGFLYLLVPVLIARTFPRVVFTFWGGMRFTLGLLAVYCAIRFFNRNKKMWLFVAGVLTALSALTSIEIGVSALGGIGAVLILRTFLVADERNATLRGLGWYAIGIGSIFIPYFAYLLQNHALEAYLDVMLSILKNMNGIFIQTEPVPGSFGQAVVAMINPLSRNFRHMTPLYAYVIFVVYFFMKRRGAEKMPEYDWGALILVGYGLIMFYAAFRNLWSNAFEMALQPEKIIFFVVLERALHFYKEKKIADPRVIMLSRAVIAGIILSSLIFPISHFQKRFFIFQILSGKKIAKIRPLAGEPTATLHLSRISGMTVPLWQAQDLQQLQDFLILHTQPDEPVLMFPELGTLHFITGRRPIGRFGMVSMSWLNERWHAEFMNDLRTTRPRYAVIPKKFPDHYYNQYFKVAANQQKFDEVVRYVEDHYTLVTSTPSWNVFVLKGK
jgi:hypothetical protein